MNSVDAMPRPVDRKNRILDGAERCFVRNGFHKSTMQDVAAECGMSPGNLYRYFPSKDAIVAGLAERDREQFNADFLSLTSAPDPAVAFVSIGRRHLVEEPRSKTIMMLEIWSEACRNPRMADIVAVMDANVMGCMTQFIEHWRKHEGVDGVGHAQDVARLVMALADGLFRLRATNPEFDPSSAFNLALPVIAHMIGVPLPLPNTSPASAPAFATIEVPA